jgi:hypothetical protein
MPELDRARTIQAAGRLVGGLTRLAPEPLPCDICKAEARQTPALVNGRTRSGETGVRMCAEHYAREGVGLGPEVGTVLLYAGPPASIEIPEGTEPAGYAKAILDYGLTVTTPQRLTFIASRGARRTLERDGRIIVVLPPGYRQGPELVSHLTFALKHEGVNLEVLSALFQRVDLVPFERELAALVAARPTGQYVRQLWFLYEFFTDRRVETSDLKTGTYVPLLDENEYYTVPGTRSPRHRILNNLLGTRAFCPMVRRTELLQEFERKSLAEEAAKIVEEFDEDAIRRAVSYLYTKETRSSFGIEGERPSSSKTERFVDLLKSVPELATLSRTTLVRLQGEAVDPRFAEGDYRTSQVYVAEPVDLTRQKIHFIAPRPEDVPSMMDGLLACQRRMDGSAIDAVVQAAAFAFGFVFVHPFEDGNGRIHRLLIHYVLSRRGFTPKGMIFPVSAVMLQRRHEYDAALERFSVPLMRLVDYDEREDGVVSVKNETAHLYRYFDATPLAEALYGWVEETVRNELHRELEFIVAFREIRQEIDSIVELPDRQANLFVKLCLQNSGHLSPAKKERHFPHLTDEEVTALEQVVQSHLERFGRAPREPEDAAANSFRRTGPRRTSS